MGDNVLLARAPLRISLAGGGTDLPDYYERYGGLVVSTTIDKHVYVVVKANGYRTAEITSADYQTYHRQRLEAPTTGNGELTLPRAVLNEFAVDRGVSVFLASEVPPGTGLGSSGAIATAMIRAVAAFANHPVTAATVADLACQVELDRLEAPVGKQDQYAAAFGGLNAITFTGSGVAVERLHPRTDVTERLQQRLLLFFTGTTRNSSTILREQRQATRSGERQTLDALHRIKEIAQACRKALEAGEVDDIGHLLNESWHHKKRLAAGISNPSLDRIYDEAIGCGALGGKITGAGGGGFLLMYCHEAFQDDLTDRLERHGLRLVDFHLSTQGAAVTSVQWESEIENEDPLALPQFDSPRKLVGINGTSR